MEKIKPFTHGSLFSGIGGFDLAADWMGWQNIFHCENNKFCQRHLKYYWPRASSHEDITSTDFTVYRGTIDIITGGFPCQPYSMAGKREGTADNRHLWPQMLRAIKEIQPRWVVGENVFGIVNWTRGLVFHEVQTDLETAGYEVFPYVLPACAVGADHRRDRVWFIAYAPQVRIQECRSVGQQEPQAYVEERLPVCYNAGRNWKEWASQSPLCGRDDGLPSKLDGITLSKWRNESMMGYGNAISPQLALQIFKTITHYENQKRT